MAGRLQKAAQVDPVFRAAGAPTPAPVEAPKPAPKKTKVGFYMDPDDAARARAAYLHTLADEEHGSFSDFVAEAVLMRVGTLEMRYNAGHEWPAAGAGKVPPGRPTRR
jgi:hypothetical protein